MLPTGVSPLRGWDHPSPTVSPGLKPCATELSPLRGWDRLPHVLSPGLKCCLPGCHRYAVGTIHRLPYPQG